MVSVTMNPVREAISGLKEYLAAIQQLNARAGRDLISQPSEDELLAQVASKAQFQGSTLLNPEVLAPEIDPETFAQVERENPNVLRTCSITFTQVGEVYRVTLEVAHFLLWDDLIEEQFEKLYPERERKLSYSGKVSDSLEDLREALLLDLRVNKKSFLGASLGWKSVSAENFSLLWERSLQIQSESLAGREVTLGWSAVTTRNNLFQLTLCEYEQEAQGMTLESYRLAVRLKVQAIVEMPEGVSTELRSLAEERLAELITQVVTEIGDFDTDVTSVGEAYRAFLAERVQAQAQLELIVQEMKELRTRLVSKVLDQEFPWRDIPVTIFESIQVTWNLLSDTPQEELAGVEVEVARQMLKQYRAFVEESISQVQQAQEEYATLKAEAEKVIDEVYDSYFSTFPEKREEDEKYEEVNPLLSTSLEEWEEVNNAQELLIECLDSSWHAQLESRLEKLQKAWEALKKLSEARCNDVAGAGAAALAAKFNRKR